MKIPVFSDSEHGCEIYVGGIPSLKVKGYSWSLVENNGAVLPEKVSGIWRLGNNHVDNALLFS